MFNHYFKLACKGSITLFLILVLVNGLSWADQGDLIIDENIELAALYDSKAKEFEAESERLFEESFKLFTEAHTLSVEFERDFKIETITRDEYLGMSEKIGNLKTKARNKEELALSLQPEFDTC